MAKLQLEDWVGLNQVQIRREEVKWEGKGSVSGSILWKCQELRGQDAREEARVFGTLGVHMTMRVARTDEAGEGTGQARQVTYIHRNRELGESCTRLIVNDSL